MIAALMSHGNIIPSERLTRTLTMAHAKALRYYGDQRRVDRALRLCISGCVGSPRATDHTAGCCTAAAQHTGSPRATDHPSANRRHR